MSTRKKSSERGGQGHNGGPPLEEKAHIPEWGTGGPGNYFAWKAAYHRAWRGVGHDTLLRRAAKADELGLTYEEYVLEILERGIYLQADDFERIAMIKSRRRSRKPASDTGR
jgi:hypothetical protein